MSRPSKLDTLTLHCRGLNLPEPTCEFRFLPPRRWRFDYAWPLEWLAVEVEGGIWKQGRHTRGKGYVGDMEKYNAAMLAGWRVLRVTPSQVQDGTAVKLVELAIMTSEHHDADL